jgi:hypothetical protein
VDDNDGWHNAGLRAVGLAAVPWLRSTRDGPDHLDGRDRRDSAGGDALVVLFSFAQRRFVSGIMSGAFKGGGQS